MGGFLCCYNGILSLGMLFCPESPRWLQSNPQAGSAEEAAEKLWGVSAASELGVALQGMA